MNGAIVQISQSGEYGLLTCDHATSSYGLPIFLPLDSAYCPSGAPARGSAEVGELTSCGYVGELPVWENIHVGWSTYFAEAVRAAGFRFGPGPEIDDDRAWEIA